MERSCRNPLSFPSLPKAVLAACCLVSLLTGGAWVLAEPGKLATDNISNIPYYRGPDQDDVRHRLDLYLPRGKKDFPVLVFYHGGAWVQGSKNQFGVYGLLARAFNRHGIGVVCPNYRLSPWVKHPEHIRDAARAFTWTCKNIPRFGGRADEIFVSGHSAGGHLCALLATDENYLREQGLTLGAIRGALPMSGLFVIPDDRLFDFAFGRDPATHRQASPIHHVGPGRPPFLVLLGDNDLPTCDRPQAEAFCETCQEKGVSAQLLEVSHRNHITILLNAITDTDPVTRTMLSFITSQVAFHRLLENPPAGLDALGQAIARYAGE